MDIKIVIFISDKHSRFVFLKTALKDNSFVVANIYAPKDVAQKTAFCSKLSKHLEEFAHDPIIIDRDFNCTLTKHENKGGNPVTNKLSVSTEINALCLNDI